VGLGPHLICIDHDRLESQPGQLPCRGRGRGF
jgi:hypothetical protein